MAKISWTSSSMQSFMNSSLNLKNNPFSGIYSSLSDASLIKKGTYSKLMKSYYASLEKSEKKTEKTEKEDYSKMTNEEIKEKFEQMQKATGTTYTSSGTKTVQTSSVIDQLL